MLRFVPRGGIRLSQETPPALKPYGEVTARLLAARGIRNSREADRFLHPSRDQLHDPFLIHHMGRAVEMLRDARDRRVPTVIYGDYDVDGICSSALLCLALRRFGVPAEPYAPLRDAGYGLNRSAVRKLAGTYGLLVTVDLGITNDEEVKLAKELGMGVIVTDHHQPGLRPCPADAVLSPLMDGYPCSRLCGAGVAFKLAQALLGRWEAMEYIDLAALATVADIVPLREENRVIVALGLPVISARKRQGFRALLEVSRSGPEADSDTLGYQLGPRLNAAGRLGNALSGVRLMMTEDGEEADEIAMELDRLNAHRKRLENEVLEQALAQAQVHDFVKDPMLLARGEGWHVGVVGLAAGRLCSRYGCPTGVFSQEGSLLHGSLRSVPGVNIHKCLQACDELLLRYGGHEQAAGCTLSAERYEAFCRRMQRAVRMGAPEEAFIPTQEYDGPLSLGEADEAVLREIDRLGPFGLENPSPLFLAEGLRLERRRACGGLGAHLQLTLRQEGRVMDGIAFGMGKEAASLPGEVDMVYRLIRNTFQGITTLQCEAKALRPARGADWRSVAAAPEQDFGMALVDALLEMPAAEEERGKKSRAAEDNTVMHTHGGPQPDWQNPPRGTLFVARTQRSALGLLEVLSPEDERPVKAGALPGNPARLPVALAWGMVESPLCFPTVLVLPVLAAQAGCWRQVWLLDGELEPAEAALWQQRLPRAQVCVCPHTDALFSLAASVDAGDEAYRLLYRRLRVNAFSALAQAAAAAEMTLPQARVGMLAFVQLGLIRFTEHPFSYALHSPVPCVLGDSPLLKALRGLRC